MAHRRVSRIASLLAVAAVLGSGCGDRFPASETTIPGDPRVAVAPTTAPATTTPQEPASTIQPLSIEELPDLGAEVRIPDGEGRFPAVVLVHGGGWVGGTPSIMSDLALHLTAEGFLTVNARYHLAASRSPGFPAALDDIACAVRYAAAHPRSDGTVALVGYSAGAHIGAVVALTGDLYGADCPIPGDGLPERFVGIAGPYDVSRVGIAAVPFFGGGPEAAAVAWEAGNPLLLTEENPSLLSLLLHGENDGIVELSHAVEFQRALSESGSEALLEMVEGARHTDLYDPAFVADLIVTWLER